MIVFNQVTKIFRGGVKALDRTSFMIPSGVLAGLLGPNGSGKTTSFKLILGLLKPSFGKVEVFGLDPWVRELEVRMRTGYLPEKPLYPMDVSVEKFLSHIAKLRRVSKQDLYRIVKLVGITHLLEKDIGVLSRGYIQRVGIAQALIGDPELLLLDEPTANLDPLARIEILELIKTLQKDLGLTAVIATHILPELQPIVDYVVFISRGHVTDYGYLEDLTKKYLVEAVYQIRCSGTRKLAKILIDYDFVKAIEITDTGLNVKIDTRYVDEFLKVIEDAKRAGYVYSISHLTSSLGDLYAKLASKS